LPGDRIAAAARRVAEELGSAGIHEVTVVGLSIGGLVALDLAIAFPHLVSRLILVDMTPHYPNEARAMWRARADRVRREGLPALIPAILEAWFTPASLEAGGAGVRYATSALSSMSPANYAWGCEALAEADYREALGRIDIPTLIVCGDHDGPVFQAAAKDLLQAIAGSRLLILRDAGHVSPLEQPAAFAHAVRDFLSTPRSRVAM
jgi:pimeloyl-ACP methyl ester carboxylesterase